MKKGNLPLSLTCLHLAFAIVLGALGAHKLKELLSPESLDAFKTGVEYHMYHALCLIGLYTIPFFATVRAIKLVRTFFTLGIVLFSGSIYLLSTSPITGLESLRPVFGPITPLGGLLFIAGWVILGLNILKKQ